jgi:amino acid permease
MSSDPERPEELREKQQQQQYSEKNDIDAEARVSSQTHSDVALNASGHRDQLQRQYGLLSICGLALNIDNAWVAFGGSLSIAVLNGGPPGILYELIVASVYYTLIAACIAELASSIPSSSGVYHWASITPGVRWGRAIGFYTGLLNFFGKPRVDRKHEAGFTDHVQAGFSILPASYTYQRM